MVGAAVVGAAVDGAAVVGAAVVGAAVVGAAVVGAAVVGGPVVDVDGGTLVAVTVNVAGEIAQSGLVAFTEKE